jgi:hypothetical protein
MASSSLASRLSFDILCVIFQRVQDLAFEDRGEYLHSGRLVGWDSNEELRSMPLVCRGWEQTAVAVLYQSVALAGGNPA